ncbi:phosphoglycerate mutase [Pelomyxa schiedti]|nr:phosphoglycerate mutase [Pelomyxa schiedti]KAH3743298.1 phosphoglycerate mutase [Pelomyxa schiedti]
MAAATPKTLKPLVGFTPRPGPVVFIILDGWGVDKPGKGNGITLADPAYYNELVATAKANNMHTLVKAHGPAVGLPADADMGNSEVGHNALGCGQIYSQGAKLVNESLASGNFFRSKNWNDVVGAAVAEGKTVHFFGLLSDGNVHSHITQLFGMMEGVMKCGGKKIRVHPLLDGRDVAPDSGLKFIGMLEEKLEQLRAAGVDARIGSGGGRMYVTMDRYGSDWGIVKRGWDAHVRGVVAPADITADYPGYFPSAVEAITCARRVYPKKLDQFNPPFVIVDSTGAPIGRMVDGDAVINFNFRGDRAVQISKAFIDENFTFFDREERPRVRYAGLLEYDTEWHIPPVFLCDPPSIHNTSSEFITATGITCYALAETHKFGHMTFFWNGNKSGYIAPALELYEEVRSLPNEATESHPEMKAAEVTDKLIAAIETGKYKWMRCNYANTDMVGHTGNIPAVVESVKVVDAQLRRVVPLVLAKKGICVITADHGNAEQMIDKAGAVMTSHTCNPVDFMIIDGDPHNDFVVDTSVLPTPPGLANLTATYINLLGYEAPANYQPSFLKIKRT